MKTNRWLAKIIELDIIPIFNLGRRRVLLTVGFNQNLKCDT